ncbi:MAG: translesion DNA synthesis-associated protein ImuA [Pseudomonadota bacterium]
MHPGLWRASQLARSSDHCIDTGYRTLSQQLPGGGWPSGNLIDLLVQQAGIGELRLLAPALKTVGGGGGSGRIERRIVLLQPPHPPQALALGGMGLAPSQLLWIKSKNSADALWAAEQVLKSGSCGALLFWAAHIRSDSLRRLHLAAQSGATLFFMLRPLASAQDSSPAPLRLALRPAAGGIEIGFVKRRGPQRDAPLFLPLAPIGVSARQRTRSYPLPEQTTVATGSAVPAEPARTAALKRGRIGQLLDQ